MTRTYGPASLPRLSRRTVLAASVAGVLLGGARARAAARVPTPAQTEGPFYPARFPADVDGDLVRVAGRQAGATGEVTHLSGRVLGLDGRPLAGAVVEIWQCDAQGRYHHPGDRGGHADPDFQGYGRALTDADGGYRFRTIKPVPYTGRTPHIHMKILAADGRRLTTQLYVAGHPANERDFLYRAARRQAPEEAIAAAFRPAPEVEAGAFAARFDVVLAERS